MPAHLGDPFREQAALAAGRAIVVLDDRGVVTVTGEDRLSWLDSLTSQSIAALQPGESAETLLLDPNGRIEHAMRVIDDGQATWLLVDAAEAPALAAWLDRMRFLMRVEVADRSADVITVGTLGQQQLPAAAPHGVALEWRDPWAAVVSGGHQYATAPAHPGSSWTYREVLVSPDADLSGLEQAGTLALEALRIAAWRPRLATEADERSIPHELDWLRSAVHLSKGCYRGQETVAKVHNLGHPPRRLVFLHLDGSEGALPEPGAEVRLGEKAVGHVTSAARHYELGPVALAVVKRTTDPDAVLTVDAPETSGVAATQELIVPPGAGATAEVPRLPRLGAR